ncbi:BON domain-containing protein, partial [Rhizobium ruizarguesonis]
MTDPEIQHDVLDELAFEPSIDAAHIGVSVEDGIATLSGHVSTYAEKLTAEEVAARVKGVR